MNDKPHTHKVQIRRRYGSAGGPIEVTYGDTTVSTLGWRAAFGITRTNHPSEKRIRKARDKAIRKHDEGSRRAGIDQGLQEELTAKLNDLPNDRWASEVLGG